MSLQNLIEERNKKFDEKFAGLELDPELRGIGTEIKQFHSNSINMIIEGVVELVEELTPQGGEANHNTYNDGQRDLRNRIISQLQILKK